MNINCKVKLYKKSFVSNEALSKKYLEMLTKIPSNCQAEISKVMDYNLVCYLIVCVFLLLGPWIFHSPSPNLGLRSWTSTTFLSLPCQNFVYPSPWIAVLLPSCFTFVYSVPVIVMDFENFVNRQTFLAEQGKCLWREMFVSRA